MLNWFEYFKQTHSHSYIDSLIEYSVDHIYCRECKGENGAFADNENCRKWDEDLDASTALSYLSPDSAYIFRRVGSN